MIGEAVAGVLRIVAADDAELVADFRGRLRLWVEGVMMAGPAPHPHEDAIHAFRARTRVRVFVRLQFLKAKKSGQRQPQSRQSADSQELTSGEAGAIAG